MSPANNPPTGGPHPATSPTVEPPRDTDAVARYPYLDSPQPLAFAHRGGAAHGIENTLDTFSRAISLGFRYLETDVHATADGVAVVFHDTTLHRLTGHPAAVADLTWKDLSTLRVAGAAVIPRLDDVLTAWPDIRFNIDVKANQAIHPTVDVINTTGSHDRVLIASFSGRRLTTLRRLLGPRVPTALTPGEVARLRLVSLLGRTTLGYPPGAAAAQVPPHRYGIPVIDRRFIDYAHRFGIPVHVWTINDPTHMHQLLDLGVDGIMTDRPEVLRDVYTARGIWP